MKTLLQVILLSMISFSAMASSSIGESMAVDSENCAIISQNPRHLNEVGNYDVPSSVPAKGSTGVSEI